MKKAGIFILALLSCLYFQAASGAENLSEGIKSGDFWKKSGQELLAGYFSGQRANWVDASKTTFRIGKPKLTLGGVKLGELLLRISEEGKPESMTIMVYNKGDDGTLDKKAFEEKIGTISEALTAMTGVEGKPFHVARDEAAVKLKAVGWTWPEGALTMESSSSKDGREFEAEFIRLRLAPTADALTRGGSGGRVSKSELLSRVEKQGKRVEIKGIPMVDQGQKGYCVVATAARVFAYYGMDFVDQHELASIGNTSSDGGTSTSEMAKALKKIGGRFQVRIKEIEAMDDFKSYQKVAKDYNRAARKLKKEPLPDFGYDVTGFWDKMNADTLRLARAGSQNQIDKWMKPVREYISQGIPVLWCLHLGIVPEPMTLSQSRGGHMRMIIGYDDDKKTIIFSDSWGAMHTSKEMPVVDAIAPTTSRMVLIPSR